MKRCTVIALAVMAAPSVLAAQEMRSAMGDVGSVRAIYDIAKGFLTRAAEQMPEENYSFKPTPEVRSFGGLVGHVADASYFFCSTVKGEKNPNSAELEKTMGKAALVKALKDAFAYCDGAYQINDMRATEEVSLMNMKGSRLWALTFNAAHDWEHYGNVVTYLRLKGLVPPSSQGGGM